MSRHDVFVSYASDDKPTADAIVARLENRGVRCWYAPRDIAGGMSYGSAIIDAIRTARIMVLVLSTASNGSDQVTNEVERAVHHQLHVIPFRIDPVEPSGDLEYFVSRRHWLDALPPPAKAHIERLADTVEAVLGQRDDNENAGAAERARRAPAASTARAGRKRFALLAAFVVLLGAATWFVASQLAAPDGHPRESSSPASGDDDAPPARPEAGSTGGATGGEERLEPQEDPRVAQGDDPPVSRPEHGVDAPAKPEPAEIDASSVTPTAIPAAPAPALALDLWDAEVGELPSGWSGDPAVAVRRNGDGLAVLGTGGQGTGSAESPRAVVRGDCYARLQVLNGHAGKLRLALLGAEGAADFLVDLSCNGVGYGNVWTIDLPGVRAQHTAFGSAAPTLFRIERRRSVYRLFGDGILLTTLRSDEFGDFAGVRIAFQEGPLAVGRCALGELRPVPATSTAEEGHADLAGTEPGRVPEGWRASGSIRRPDAKAPRLAAASAGHHRLVSPTLDLAGDFELVVGTDNVEDARFVLTLLGAGESRDLPLYFEGLGSGYNHEWRVGLPGAERRRVFGAQQNRFRLTRTARRFQLFVDDQAVEAVQLRGFERFAGLHLDFLDTGLSVTEIAWRPLSGRVPAAPARNAERAEDRRQAGDALLLRPDPHGAGALPPEWTGDANVAIDRIEGVAGLRALRGEGTATSPAVDLAADSYVAFDLRHRQATRLTLSLESGFDPLPQLELSNSGPGYSSLWTGQFGGHPFKDAGLRDEEVHTFRIERTGGTFRLFVDSKLVITCSDPGADSIRSLRWHFHDPECWLARLRAGKLDAGQEIVNADEYVLEPEGMAGSLPAGWSSPGSFRRAPENGGLTAASNGLERVYTPPFQLGLPSFVDFALWNRQAARVRITLLGANGAPDLVVRCTNQGEGYGSVWLFDLPGCSQRTTPSRGKLDSRLRIERSDSVLRLSLDGQQIEAVAVAGLGPSRGIAIDSRGADLRLMGLTTGPAPSMPRRTPEGRLSPYAVVADGGMPEGWSAANGVGVVRDRSMAALRNLSGEPATLECETTALATEGGRLRVGLVHENPTQLDLDFTDDSDSAVRLALQGSGAGYVFAWKGSFGGSPIEFASGGAYAPLLLELRRAGDRLALHVDGVAVADTAFAGTDTAKCILALHDANVGMTECRPTRTADRPDGDAASGFDLRARDVTAGTIPPGWQASDAIRARPGSSPGIGTTRPGWFRLQSPPVRIVGDFAATVRLLVDATTFVVTFLADGVSLPVHVSNAGAGYGYRWTVTLPAAEPRAESIGSTGTAQLRFVRSDDRLRVWIDGKEIAACDAAALGALEQLRIDFGDEHAELVEASLQERQADKGR